MTFLRLNRGDVAAFIAALALLPTLALTWYTTQQGVEDRQIQHTIIPAENQADIPTPSDQAAQAAKTHEKNAWQASAPVDRLLLIAALAAITLAIGAAYMRAAGRRPRSWPTAPGLSPSALASLFGLAACALITYRLIVPPGLRSAAVLEAGAPLALLFAGVLTIGARVATRLERRVPAAPSEGIAEPLSMPDTAPETAPLADAEPAG